MKLLCRYLDNYEGEISIDNRNLSTYNLLDIRNKITYLSQDEVLYTDTIYNNIVLEKDISYEKYLEIIKITGVNEIINRSMIKDNMMLDNNGSNLSGGEIQRILLARSLVKNSDIYIFDESFSALDIKNERKIIKDVFEYLKNKTVIVISHRFNNRDSEEEQARNRTEKSFFVPKDEIISNDYDLSINKYKKTEYVAVEYPPTSEIMAKLKALQEEISMELAELEGLLGE